MTCKARVVRHRAADGSVIVDNLVFDTGFGGATATLTINGFCYTGTNYNCISADDSGAAVSNPWRILRDTGGDFIQIDSNASGMATASKMTFNGRDLCIIEGGATDQITIAKVDTLKTRQTALFDNATKMGICYDGNGWLEPYYEKLELTQGRNFWVWDSTNNKVQLWRFNGATLYLVAEPIAVGAALTPVHDVATNGRDIAVLQKRSLSNGYSLKLFRKTGELIWTVNAAPTNWASNGAIEWNGRDWLVVYATNING